MKFRFRRCGSGSEFSVEAPRSRYAVGRYYWFDSKLDGSQFKCRCIAEPKPLLRCEAVLGHTKGDSAGINPDFVDEHLAADQAAGFTGINYTSEGEIVFPDRKTRKRYLENMMIYDKDCGYSGAQRLDARERAIRAAGGII